MTAYMFDTSLPRAIAEADTGDVVQMVKAEYLEMPGLCLTLAQAQRLWDLDRETCAAVLRELVESGFLRRTEEGAFGLVTCARCTPPPEG